MGNISLIGETYRNGMASVLSAKCSSCRMEIAFSTSQKVEGVGSGKRWECNVAAVWGQMSTGGGHAHLKETMSTLGVPTLTKKRKVGAPAKELFFGAYSADSRLRVTQCLRQYEQVTYSGTLRHVSINFT